MPQEKELSIVATVSANPQVCKFTLSVDLLKDNSFHCKTNEQSKGSPLLEAIMNINGVQEVLVTQNSLIVKKNESASPWKELGALIGPNIRKIFNEGQAFFTPDFFTQLKKDLPEEEGPKHHHAHHGTHYHGKILTDHSLPAELIEEILIEKVSPALGAHGGNAKLVKVENRNVYLQFGGGCQGCAQISVTVKQGIEKILRQAVPSINEIIDLTDHSSGENPYY